MGLAEREFQALWGGDEGGAEVVGGAGVAFDEGVEGDGAGLGVEGWVLGGFGTAASLDWGCGEGGGEVEVEG